ncbi:hypothetical protein DO021_20260 [Desulfobacter hydrogenophilus]|uniref:Uncharacterized protein n=1 Tax=Desulfobacter hydrogenophilus TaxID=2291 RepID=A0A328FAS3_9BACT|nr:hypothetical protein DO021_20260 [Desulfobacter hydrogenophilus]
MIRPLVKGKPVSLTNGSVIKPAGGRIIHRHTMVIGLNPWPCCHDSIFQKLASFFRIIREYIFKLRKQPGCNGKFADTAQGKPSCWLPTRGQDVTSYRA